MTIEVDNKGQYILDEFASNLVTPKVIIESGVIEMERKLLSKRY